MTTHTHPLTHETHRRPLERIPTWAMLLILIVLALMLTGHAAF